MDKKTFASLIDNTLLQPDVTKQQVEAFCKETKELGCAAVFINSCWLPITSNILMGSNTKIGCSIGFPLGSTATEIKRMETTMCIENGANEVDMQINLGAFKSKDYDYVNRDIQAVKEAITASGKDILLKVIIESCFLSTEEIKIASKLVADAGADFVKTSSGFASSGATVEAVQSMFEAVGNRIRVKASGGIRDLNTCHQMLAAGASRLGTSRGAELIKEFEKASDRSLGVRE